MKKKALRAFSVVVLTGVSLLAAGILAFFILIVAGVSPKLQTIWICSAMRTMSHKYLATAFFSEDYIAEVMAANEVDDTGYNSDILTFPKKTPPETAPDPNEGLYEILNKAPETEETTPETEEIPEETDVEPEPEPETEPEPEPYICEGYELLEEGLYLKEVSGTTWRGYVMLVEDPLRVKLVDTSQQYTCGENVMTMTENAGAVAGINGGGFQDGANYDSNGGTPAGLLIEDRQMVCPAWDDGTVYNMIGINGDGALILRHCTAAWALENDIVSAVSFSPFLVVNGEGLIKNGTGGWGIAPRTAIGQRETGEFLLLVIDGRQVDWSIGCDLDVLQEVMLAENAYNAAMLDGGSSTAMVYNGEYINRPSLGHERWINNCFVVE